MVFGASNKLLIIVSNCRNHPSNTMVGAVTTRPPAAFSSFTAMANKLTARGFRSLPPLRAPNRNGCRSLETGFSISAEP